MAENNLRRDQKLKKQLAREYQVDRPPESYFQAVQDALDSLPDELTVKRRPLPQRMLRGFAACAACLVLLAAGAYGLDLAAPGLMESVPGVGQIFQELNHREEQEQDPTPAPVDPDPSQVDQEQLPDVPEFLPVDVINEENTAMLSVNDARCDGYYVTLDLELQVWDPSMAQCYLLSPCSNPMDPASNEATLILMDSQQAEPLSEQNDFSFQLAGSGNTDSTVFSATWKFRLPQELSHGEGFSGSLEIGTLYGLQEGSDQVFSFPVSLSVVFDSYADLRDTFVYQQPISDNGIVLNQVVVTPSAVVTNQYIPYFGTLDSTLLVAYDSLTSDTHTLLGCYPVLTTQDGTQLTEISYPVGDQRLNPYTSDYQAQGTLTFAPPPENTTRLILTMYEYPHSDAWLPENPQSNRVTAEFTIDLENGTVYASQNYLLEGRQKLDHTLSSDLSRTPTPANGYICGPVELSGNYAQVTLYTKEENYHPTSTQPISLRCYINGELWGTYSSVGDNEFNAGGDTSFYQGENYSFSHQTLVDPDPTVDGPYEALRFRIWNLPQGMELRPDQITFDLVDQDTGILVDDLVRTYYIQKDSVLGTHFADSYLSDSSISQADPSPDPSHSEVQDIESTPWEASPVE